MKLKSLNLSVECALENIEGFESSVGTIVLDSNVEVNLSPENHIQLRFAGLEYHGFANSALIHQFGCRLWKGCNLADTTELWRQCNNPELSRKLGKALSSSGSVLRFTQTSAGRKIYGLTSSRFPETRQSQFRSQLTNALKQYGITPEKGATVTPYGEVVEKFSVPTEGGQVGLSCRAIYGLNNGYSSYRLSWGRMVLVCSNGLTAYQSVGKNRWLHTGEIEISDFVNDSANDAFSHLSAVEKQIAGAQSRSVNSAKIDQFLTRLAVAAATKERVASRIEHELNDTGRNDWSISQALTYLGEHEKAIPNRVREDLTRVGSSLLERSLSQVISSPSFITKQGYYDIIR